MTLEAIWPALLLGALTLSLGWGVRGNFGHESGAALPGALAAMALVLASGRPDWMERIHLIALAAALGWSIGGSMSYMQVVGYTHSGHTPTVLYGFANLFAIGFLWAFPGGIGFGLAASLPAEQLTLFLAPIGAALVGWTLQEALVDRFVKTPSNRRHESPLYWRDSDWLEALTAAAAFGLTALFRGGFDIATSFLTHLAVGWFGGFLLLAIALNWRMTPPRGDNWAGCVGICAGAAVFCLRESMTDILAAALIAALIGGVGFAFAQILKLIWIRTGLNANWHSGMEQKQGAFFGLGLAAAMLFLAERAPSRLGEELPLGAHLFALAFLLAALLYVNHRKAAGSWVQQIDSLPERMFGLPVVGWLRASRGWFGWFELLYLCVAAVVLCLTWAHEKIGLPLVPSSAMGRGQALCLLFMFWIAVFNFERALPSFAPGRLMTEGTIALNALVCAALTALLPIFIPERTLSGAVDLPSAFFGFALGYGILAAAGVTALGWAVSRALFGKQHVPGAGLHIRFGPDRNANAEKPKRGANHP